MNLPKLIAGVLASLLMSVIWYLASPPEKTQQNLTDLTLLRTPLTLTLQGGRQVRGELQGIDSLCADWKAALQANPDTRVRLPDGTDLSGRDVQTLTAGQGGLTGLKAMETVSACPDTLTLHAPGETPSGQDGLTGASASVTDMKRALKDLTGP